MILAYKGIKIKYLIAGKGSPILFLHGFLENASMWQDTFSELSNDYTCIAIDLLGHGGTQCMGYIHTMETMAEAVDAVVQHLQLEPFVIVGHSMGGYVALAYAELFLQKISGLALLNSTALPDNQERKINRGKAIAIVKKTPNAYTSMAIANLFAQKNRSEFLSHINNLKNQASNMPVQGIIAALEGMKIRKDRSSLLSSLTVPKIIFAGIKDSVISYDQSVKEAHQHNVKIVSFDGGHMSYLENRDDYISELQHFIKGFSS
ncbi:alpha/beta fold hydrolase [Aquimarina algicola]|uniref:Alpha/beta hydrolase n=1 Tax=Aquimarina algicola TaxID=2589995 RepID=A0A504JGF2_9FLAO|nr:alpha/beta hydrolase [Aquimarina algicola]TPN87792.1 alpha/beta hydrolase [Aquimarina algicola]